MADVHGKLFIDAHRADLSDKMQSCEKPATVVTNGIHGTDHQGHMNAKWLAVDRLVIPFVERKTRHDAQGEKKVIPDKRVYVASPQQQCEYIQTSEVQLSVKVIAR